MQNIEYVLIDDDLHTHKTKLCETPVSNQKC